MRKDYKNDSVIHKVYIYTVNQYKCRMEASPHLKKSMIFYIKNTWNMNHPCNTLNSDQFSFKKVSQTAVLT